MASVEAVGVTDTTRLKPRATKAISRVMFAGLGGIGQRHLRNLRSILGDKVEIIAYRVRGERQALDDMLHVVPGVDLEQSYGVKVLHCLDSALELMPDVVFVTNPTSLHVPLALRAAKAGAHLFIEKPLAHSLDGVEELATVLEERGLLAMVGYQMRFHPGFLRLQALLREGAIGEVYSVQAEVGEFLPHFHPYEDYRRMYASRKDLGGGVTLSQIHEIDYLCALFGTPRRVFSMGGKVSSLDIDVDDIACSLLEFERPHGRSLTAELHQDFLQRPTSRKCLVMGESGKIEWSMSNRQLTWIDAQGQIKEQQDYSKHPRNHAYMAELSHFLECIQSSTQPLIPLRAGIQSLKVALGLLESQVTGLPVRFSE